VDLLKDGQNLPEFALVGRPQRPSWNADRRGEVVDRALEAGGEAADVAQQSKRGVPILLRVLRAVRSPATNLS
jgi:hypothetical protein